MRFPAQIFQDRYTEQLMQADLNKLRLPDPPGQDEVTRMGRTLQAMFADKTLVRMWIDRDTQEVLCE
jgi:hypothetical protein